jgi:hypothetical protein
VTRESYPASPIDFSADPDVVSTWVRFEGFKNGHEPLPSMAYFCFTLLKHKYGGQEEASKALAVHRDILRKIGDLSSNRGDPSNARKVTSQKFTPFTSAEAEWLDAAIRALIRRSGQVASGNSPQQLLTMRQLPQI